MKREKSISERWRQAGFRLMLVTGEKRGGEKEFISDVKAAVRGGVEAVQLRVKSLLGRALYELGEQLRQELGGQARLVINDRVDVALALAADGVHLPARGLSVAVARKLCGRRMLIGKSCHSLKEAMVAEEEGADYVIFGPVYATPSKREFGPGQGVEALAAVVRAVHLPVVAIGGVQPARVAELKAAGVQGLAVQSYILEHPDAGEAARELLRVWEKESRRREEKSSSKEKG